MPYASRVPSVAAVIAVVGAVACLLPWSSGELIFIHGGSVHGYTDASALAFMGMEGVDGFRRFIPFVDLALSVAVLGVSITAAASMRGGETRAISWIVMLSSALMFAMDVSFFAWDLVDDMGRAMVLGAGFYMHLACSVLLLATGAVATSYGSERRI